MRIVIGGRDEVARRLGEALSKKHEIVFLVSGEGGRDLDHIDAMVVEGDMDSAESLEKAGVAESDAFVACSRYDERNIVACVVAKRMGAQRTICFLFQRGRLTRSDDPKVAESIGIDLVVRPADQLAHEIVRIATVPGALDVQFFAGGRVRLLQHLVEEGSPITRGPIRQVKLPSGVVLVMGRRGGQAFIPKGDTHFQAGDRVTAMGDARGLERLTLKYLRSADHGTDARSATIVGGGAVGLAVARGLTAARWNVRVIEFDRRRAERIAPLVNGLVIHGDGSDLELLEQEQVRDDSVLVAVTSNDEKNLLVSLVAKSLGIPRIVTRADSLQNERLFEHVGIDVVRSARGAAIDLVLRTLDKDRRELLAELEHGDAEVLDLVVPEGVRPMPLHEIHQPVFAIVGAILRAGKVIIPTGRDHLEAGDHILVFCRSEEEVEVRRFMTEGIKSVGGPPA
jgi:trk system potassium uptake protein TrkA